MTTLLGQALWPTLLLTVCGTLVSVLVGVPLGVVAALKRRTWLDYLASVGALLGISIPVFVWGVLLLLAFSLQWPILPSAGAKLFLSHAAYSKCRASRRTRAAGRKPIKRAVSWTL